MPSGLGLGRTGLTTFREPAGGTPSNPPIWGCLCLERPQVLSIREHQTFRLYKSIRHTLHVWRKSRTGIQVALDPRTGTPMASLWKCVNDTRGPLVPHGIRGYIHLVDPRQADSHHRLSPEKTARASHSRPRVRAFTRERVLYRLEDEICKVHRLLSFLQYCADLGCILYRF